MHRLTCIVLVIMLATGLAGLLSACGASDEESGEWARQDGEIGQALGQDQFELESLLPGRQGSPGEPGLPGLPGNPANAAAQAPAPPAAPAPAPAAAAAKQVVQEVAVERGQADAMQGSSEADSTRAQLVTQRRIIIREVDMSLVVDEIQAAIDKVADIADAADGWVVDSGRWSLHSGSISIRVPADVLDDTVENLRRMAIKVEAENTSSRDVTDEYVDLGSRLKNQQATQGALLALLDRTASVEAALEVQKELSRVQEEVERLSGRIKFLEESAAFSIIRVNLSLAPVEVTVDAGPDQTVAVGMTVKFRATFTPPDGIEDYTITWDFGDATDPQTIYRTAPTQTPGELTTATVNHWYDSISGSPFIAQVSITGTGEGGIVEGKDTITVSVSEIPAIEVFTDDFMDAVQNTEVHFSGSFTRPQGLTDVRFEWDFGDGQPPVTGDLPEGVTRAFATHVYRDYRREPYTARLTITAESEVGEIKATRTVEVFVAEQLGFVVGGYDFADTLKSAVRGLSAFAQSLAVVLIWVAIFVPIWAAIGAVIWLIVRAWRWRRSRREESMPESQMDSEA